MKLQPYETTAHHGGSTLAGITPVVSLRKHEVSADDLNISMRSDKRMTDGSHNQHGQSPQDQIQSRNDLKYKYSEYLKDLETNK